MVYHGKSYLNDFKLLELDAKLVLIIRFHLNWGILHVWKHRYLCWMQLPHNLTNSLFTLWKSNMVSWTMPHLKLFEVSSHV